MNRQEYNRKIISKLSELVEKYPDLRFGQLLVDCDIIRQEIRVDDVLTIDPFNEESEIIWQRMKDNKFAFKELYN
jgi:hypothetical protein